MVIMHGKSFQLMMMVSDRKKGPLRDMGTGALLLVMILVLSACSRGQVADETVKPSATSLAIAITGSIHCHKSNKT